MSWLGQSNSKANTINHLIGSCHTPIEAHRKLLDHLITQRMSFRGLKREDFHTEDEQFLFDRKAEEIEFLEDFLVRLEKHIGFKPTPDDYQNNYNLEWKLEFKFRAENFLICHGAIPPQEFATMRQHPDFKEIAQHIQEVKAIADAGEYHKLSAITNGTKFLLEDKCSQS